MPYSLRLATNVCRVEYSVSLAMDLFRVPYNMRLATDVQCAIQRETG